MFNEKSRLQIRTGNQPEIWTDVSSYTGGTGIPVNILNTLVTQNYDYISCSYTGDNLTGVVFKTGGSTGTTVATLALTYDGSNNLLTVTKS
jgi:hypothetical protein